MATGSKTKGRYIVIEGVEGTGKGTQIEKLRERLEKMGEKVLVVREPGDTPVGEEIRKILKSPYIDRTPEAEIFLVSAARAEMLRSVVLPALEKGIHVLSDRSSLSTLAYQVHGHDREDLRHMFEVVTKEAVGRAIPDMTIILDINVEEGLRRAIARNGGKKDRFDDFDTDFHSRVRASYLESAKKNDYPVIFASYAIDIVAENIWREVKDLF